MKFQFHKGAIGVITPNCCFCVIISFQFHKGAIGVNKLVAHLNNIKLFQFHKGAIGVLVYSGTKGNDWISIP